MTLHHLGSRASGRIWWWYAAIPNERTGRRHLLHVPWMRKDTGRVIIPPYINNLDEERIERYRNAARREIPTTPAQISTTFQQLERACATRQEARIWLTNHRNITRQARGVCSDCLDFARNLPTVGFCRNIREENSPWNAPEYNTTTPSGIANRGTQEWVQYIERQWYGTN